MVQPIDGKTAYLFRLKMNDTWFHHNVQNPNYVPSNVPVHVGLKTSMCRQSDLDDPRLGYWHKKYMSSYILPGDDSVVIYHAKHWEIVYILQSVFECGFMKSGARGVGFGVGGEPMGSVFVDAGCQVVLTDQPGDGGKWGAQHAKGLPPHHPDKCLKADWDRLASFRPVDMRKIPADLTGFDFCWSCCALEHLGSLEAGWNFVMRTLDCLKPGGVSVHTTAYNIESNDATFDKGPTVWYRKRDMETLRDRAKAAGHLLAELDLDPGDGPLDRLIDGPPVYHNRPVLKLMMGPYLTTCIGLIIRKAV